ncbi:MAG: hypothetical protein QM760_01995 [Nibricoccus sp.]
MARLPKMYTRLTRSPIQLGSYKSLWLGADHLMQVDTNGYTENYQRFQFGDVQRSSRLEPAALLESLFWSLVALIAGIPIVIALTDEVMPGVSLVITRPRDRFFNRNDLLGPSCRVYLVTKVQTLHLAGGARRRKANKVLGQIQPLIESAQSSLAAPVVIQPGVAGHPARLSQCRRPSRLRRRKRLPPCCRRDSLHSRSAGSRDRAAAGEALCQARRTPEAVARCSTCADFIAASAWSNVARAGFCVQLSRENHNQAAAETKLNGVLRGRGVA